MRIRLNGVAAELGDDAKVADATRLAGVEGDARGVAVAVDGEVVSRFDWENYELCDGMSVEVLRAVQGG